MITAVVIGLMAAFTLAMLAARPQPRRVVARASRRRNPD